MTCGWPPNFLQASEQMLPLNPGVFYQRLLFDDVDDRATDPARQRVAAKRAAMTAGREQLRGFASRQAGTDRYAVAQPFGEGHDVRHDAFMLKGKPLARATHAGLNLVEHQQPVTPRATFSQRLEIPGRRDLSAALALNRFDQHGSNTVAVGYTNLVERGQITERHLDVITRQVAVTQAHRRPVAGPSLAASVPSVRP